MLILQMWYVSTMLVPYVDGTNLYHMYIVCNIAYQYLHTGRIRYFAPWGSDITSIEKACDTYMSETRLPL
jgi:hypothetical protein